MEFCAYVRSDISCTTFDPDVDTVCGVNNIENIEILWIDSYSANCHYLIACCYHPPKPKYDASQFINVLSADIDYINTNYHDAVIIVAGDFNQLDTTFIVRDHGLVQMVNSPTHCGHLIDKIFENRPDIYTCAVFNSVLKTKHSAVLLTVVRQTIVYRNTAIGRKYLCMICVVIILIV